MRIKKEEIINMLNQEIQYNKKELELETNIIKKDQNQYRICFLRGKLDSLRMFKNKIENGI